MGQNRTLARAIISRWVILEIVIPTRANIHFLFERTAQTLHHCHAPKLSLRAQTAVSGEESNARSSSDDRLHVPPPRSSVQRSCSE